MRPLRLAACAGLLALGGCVPPTTEDLCMDRIEAVCAKEAACRNDQPAADCVISRKNECATRPDLVLCANGTPADPDRSVECSNALANAGCAELNGGDQPAACIDACDGQ